MKVSRSVRHRYALRGVPVPSAAVRVHVELRDVRGVSQSFLILPGRSYEVRLEGYRDAYGRMERIILPITINANTV